MAVIDTMARSIRARNAVFIGVSWFLGSLFDYLLKLSSRVPPPLVGFTSSSVQEMAVIDTMARSTIARNTVFIGVSWFLGSLTDYLLKLSSRVPPPLVGFTSSSVQEMAVIDTMARSIRARNAVFIGVNWFSGSLFDYLLKLSSRVPPPLVGFTSSSVQEMAVIDTMARSTIARNTVFIGVSWFLGSLIDYLLKLSSRVPPPLVGFTSSSVQEMVVTASTAKTTRALTMVFIELYLG